MRYAQIVVGPAGSGKTTYCKALQEYLSACRRRCHIINLDPATEEDVHFEDAEGTQKVGSSKEEYSTFDTDIRDFVDIGTVIEEDELGPNAALVKSAEMLTDNIEWLAEQIEETYSDESYLLFDTPGQVELFVHLSYVKSISQLLYRLNINAVAVFLLDVSFMADPTKLIAGSMAGLAAMANLQLPHINVLTKCDLLYDAVSDGQFKLRPFLDITSSTFGLSASDLAFQRDLFKNPSKSNASDDEGGYSSYDSDPGFDDEPTVDYDTLCGFINRGPDDLLNSLDSHLPPKYKRLNSAFASLLEDYNLISFVPLNINDEGSLEQLVVATDICLQYGEDAEPRANFDMNAE
ncbi:ATP binding protein family protein [Babesia bovis T2Bo]|uniref:GPN-loop GTPase 3 n=1 Tax=Babesia bovis TaxID=5865 RepID=A7ARF4_BABBO|nr:ATP binding protein family protein [Babesia bovis T2Bo]EDO07123.1 ATP binding protein family protein [Babesia bovis T2Bo]|eukprot:XP_001610691.1 ATP binding protein [Babesia bovis T2Bo]